MGCGRWFGLVAALLIASPAMAQEFSADLVTRGSAAQPTQKIFVSGDKARVETGDADGSVLIADSSAGVAYMMMPPQRLYIVSTNAVAVDMARLFHPADPNDPCTEWLKLVADRGPGATCLRVGEETIDGRPTIKFEGVSPEHEHGFAWVDPALHYIIKVESANGDGMALEHIVEAPQPTELFTVPADYRRVDPEGPERRSGQP
jgi:hypothetical protein